MTEIQLQLREQKTLKALSETTEPVRASDLAEITGETPLNIGNSLRQLAKLGVAELMDKRSKLWQITESGRQNRGYYRIASARARARRYSANSSASFSANYSATTSTADSD